MEIPGAFAQLEPEAGCLGLNSYKKSAQNKTSEGRKLFHFILAGEGDRDIFYLAVSVWPAMLKAI